MQSVLDARELSANNEYFMYFFVCCGERAIEDMYSMEQSRGGGSGAG